jgi:ParB family chromosome partitioning protein
MSKEFAPRVSKKEREKIDFSSKLNANIFKTSDQKILEGARLSNIKLSDIEVRKQVRTYFNDDSIKELADNIKVNGLIQPLVIHRENNKFVLICGERRYRALTYLKMQEASCFVLENKTNEELLSIQFSENSSRENLHYIDVADSIYQYQQASGASERKIMVALGVSKTEVHRSLLLARLPVEIKQAAKAYKLEKYVLLEWDKITQPDIKKALVELIASGRIRKRSELRTFLTSFKTLSVESRETRA